MSTESPLQFRIATQDWEFEAVHRLNYKTFVEEIPQHARNPEERLVDKFNAENTYAICLHGDRLVGMVAGRGARPFSLDQKLPNLDAHLPAGHRIVEVRLLSVEKEYRNGPMFAKLVGLLAHHFREQGFDMAIISGTLKQLKLYTHLGFVPFGPVVGTGDAQFQPMYLTLDTFIRMAKALSPPSAAVASFLANLLPGPVDVHEEVRRAFAREPVSHRADAFIGEFQATRKLLLGLTGAHSVEILVGSGSLANDVIGGQLKVLGERGLLLSNGEFGDRLIDGAARWGLEFDSVKMAWGEPFDLADLRRRLGAAPRPGWLWVTHCETSTGVLNDLPALQVLCAERGIKLCLDAISSIGTVPVDLSGVYLASCVSGKALASYPGLSMVFSDHAPAPAPGRLPRYLDLGYWAEQDGIPFTHSSNLIFALQTALRRIDWPEKYRQIAAASAWLHARLRELGLQIVAPDAHASPAVVTLALPAGVSSKTIGWRLKKSGFLLSYNSGYLLQRNWIQICLMGEWTRENIEPLPDTIAALCAQRRRARHDESGVAVAG